MQQSNFGNFGSFNQNPQNAQGPRGSMRSTTQNVGSFSSVPGNKFMGATPNMMQSTDPTIQIPSKPRLRVTLNNSERGPYSSMLSQADPVESNKVQGKGAVAFFKKFGLGVEILKKIWVLASSNQDYLDREDFYVALKLISYAQNGIDVSEDSILKNIPSPLPKFAEVQAKKEEPPVISKQEEEVSNQGMLPNQTPVNPVENKASGFNNEALHRPSMNFTGFNAASKATVNAPVQVSPKESTLELMKNYEKYYNTADPTNKGEVGGVEAREIFIRSGLPQPTLFKIWNLVDTRKSGSLKKPEFLIALHLIMLAKRGEEIGDSLPENLINFILEYKQDNETINAAPSIKPSPVSTKISSQGAGDNLMDFDNSENKEVPQEKGKKYVDKYDVLDDQTLLAEQSIYSKINPGAIQNMPPQIDKKRESQELQPLPQMTQEKASVQAPVKQPELPNYQANLPPVHAQPAYSGAPVTETIKEYLSVKTDVSNMQRKVGESQQAYIHDLGHLREFHASIIEEKNNELNFLTSLHENYLKLSKKLQDENFFLVEEIKKIDEKKEQYKKGISSVYQQLMVEYNKNFDLRKQYLAKSQAGFEEIAQFSTESMKKMAEEQDRVTKNILTPPKAIQPEIKPQHQKAQSQVIATNVTNSTFTLNSGPEEFKKANVDFESNFHLDEIPVKLRPQQNTLFENTVAPQHKRVVSNVEPDFGDIKIEKESKFQKDDPFTVGIAGITGFAGNTGNATGNASGNPGNTFGKSPLELTSQAENPFKIEYKNIDTFGDTNFIGGIKDPVLCQQVLNTPVQTIQAVQVLDPWGSPSGFVGNIENSNQQEHGKQLAGMEINNKPELDSRSFGLQGQNQPEKYIEPHKKSENEQAWGGDFNKDLDFGFDMNNFAKEFTNNKAQDFGNGADWEIGNNNTQTVGGGFVMPGGFGFENNTNPNGGGFGFENNTNPNGGGFGFENNTNPNVQPQGGPEKNLWSNTDFGGFAQEGFDFKF